MGVPEGGKAEPRHQCGSKRRVYAIPTNTGNNQMTLLWTGCVGAGQ